MAMYHFSCSICNGGFGAAVAASSYQSAAKMRDSLERTKDYPHKERVAYANLITPDNAPEWAKDREKLWNEVEKREGMNGQYARKYDIGLPNELTEEQQIALADDVAEYFRSKGMCVDYAVHQDLDPKKPADQRNPHLHIMTTMRAFNQDGSWAQKWRNVTVRDRNGKAICVGRDKNGRKRYKHVKMALNNWSERDELINQRHMVADLSNAALAKAGFSARVDHRSYLDQGILKIPTKHLGHKAAALERAGMHTERGDYNRRVRAINAKLKNANDRVVLFDKKIEEEKENERKRSSKKITRERRTRARRNKATISRKSFAARKIKMYYVRERVVSQNINASRKSFASSKSYMFMHSKRARASMERRRYGKDNYTGLRQLRLVSYSDLTRDERNSVLRELNKDKSWLFASDKEKYRFNQQAMFLRSGNRVALYPLGRDASRFKPGDIITKQDMYADCKSAYSSSRGAGAASSATSEAGQSLKGACQAISDIFDENKKTIDHLKQAAQNLKNVAKAPVDIAKDIISNPITGLLKAPLRVASAAAEATSAAINVSAAGLKAGTKGKSSGHGGGGYSGRSRGSNRGDDEDWDNLTLSNAAKDERREKQLYRNI